ncbi:MAG: hypothetical protein HN368_21680 [Spirochaetales bacterium]|jgi:hypothetical protein|nr:hypothetical protein [Spirochaetales bacterium]
MFQLIILFLSLCILSSAASFFIPGSIFIAVSISFAMAGLLLLAVRRGKLFQVSGDIDSISGVTLDHHRTSVEPEPEVDQDTDEIQPRVAELESEIRRYAGILEQYDHTLEKISEITGPDAAPETEGKGSLPKKDPHVLLERISGKFRDDFERIENHVISIKSQTADLDNPEKEGYSIGEEDALRYAGELKHLTGSLEELADQSNILAINGAIEAARIGKSGKGFSVISSEMQRFSGEMVELVGQLKMINDSAGKDAGQRRTAAAHKSQEKDTLRRIGDGLDSLADEVASAVEESRAERHFIEMAEMLNEMEKRSESDNISTDKLNKIQKLLNRT